MLLVITILRHLLTLIVPFQTIEMHLDLTRVLLQWISTNKTTTYNRLRVNNSRPGESLSPDMITPSAHQGALLTTTQILPYAVLVQTGASAVTAPLGVIPM